MRSLAVLLFAAVLFAACTDEKDASPTPPEPAGTETTLPSPEATPIDTNVIRPRDLVDLARRLRGVEGDVPEYVNPTPPNYAVGDRHLFNVTHMAPPGEAGEVRPRIVEIWATVRLVTPHAYFYIQDGEDFSQEDLEAAGEAFEQTIYPTITTVFGKEPSPGIDNDQHVTLLHARLEGAAGYFSDLDTHPRAICPKSNERDMVYLDLPSLSLGSDTYVGILAHEFQHLVNHAVDDDEELWLNEGLSELAATLVREGTSFGSAFLDQPDTQLNSWAADGDNYAHYGAADLFARYLALRAGGTSNLREFVAAPENGTAGVSAFLAGRGVGLDFFDVFRDWVVTNYLDGEDGSGVYNYPDLEASANPTLSLSEQASGGETVHQFGADYFEIRLSDGEQGTFTFDGAESVGVVPTTAHSDRTAWWGARGDGIDTSLTKELDLTGLSKATLRFWTWFDIERWYDYGYVEVSTDEGRTWQALPGRVATLDDPLGQAYGPGYTGRSGSEDEPAWAEEEIDLSRFAGQQILLRFEYVTDGGVNSSGWLIDDIRVPEADFEDDVEDEAGWTPAGFRRLSSPLLQRFLVQVIEFGESTEVRQALLDNGNRASIELADAGESLDAVVVVSALTEGTTEPASYQYGLTVTP